MKRKFLAILLCVMMNTPIYPMAIDQATFKVGQRFFEQGLYSEAEPRFLDIVRKYPDSPAYHQSLFYLGQTYAHLGKYKPALQYYKILLNKSKTVTEKQKALLGIAKSWLQLGVHDKAGDFYAFFAAEYPESEYAPAALYFTGIARERENKVGAAIEKYKTVLELYPESDYYAKSIEKVAVLDSNTPESLWEDAQVPEMIARKGSIDMFVDEIDEENIDFDEQAVYTAQNTPKNQASNRQKISNNQGSRGSVNDSNFESIDLKAQATPVEPIPYKLIEPTQYQQNTPTVLTQFIQSTPTIITQTVVETVTQELETPKSITPETQKAGRQITQEEDEIQKLMQADIVQKTGNQYIPVENSEEYQKKQTLAAYKKLWEEEYRLKLKEQELENTKLKVKDLAQLSSEKAQILQIKEESLKEQQNRIHNTIYQDLSKEVIVNKVKKFNEPPAFTQGTEQMTIPQTPTGTLPKVENTGSVKEVTPVAPIEEEEPIEEGEEYEYYDEEYYDEEYYEEDGTDTTYVEDDTEYYYDDEEYVEDDTEYTE